MTNSDIVGLAERVKVLENALAHARGAIACLDEAELGYVEPQGPDETGWPIQAELLHMIDAALSGSPEG